MDFVTALGIAQSGFDAWKSKPHNSRWFRKIDGTPIPNDLMVCVAEAFGNSATHPPAAEREALGGVVPEGWKLVPVEATPAMLAAYHEGAAQPLDHVAYRAAGGFPKAEYEWAFMGYRAMLAAAPPPPANIGGDGVTALAMETRDEIKRHIGQLTQFGEKEWVRSTARKIWDLLATPAEGGGS